MAKLKRDMAPEGSEPLVQLGMRIEGVVHPFEEFEASGNWPVIKTIGMMRASKAHEGWVSVVVTSQGPKVLKIEPSHPSLKPIAKEDAQTKFVFAFDMDDDEVE